MTGLDSLTRVLRRCQRISTTSCQLTRRPNSLRREADATGHEPTIIHSRARLDLETLNLAVRRAMMDADSVYWWMIAAFFTHELDAVKRHEWRVLPLTSWMPERLGEQVFIWCHVPLFFLIFWFSTASPTSGFRIGLSTFALIHVGLHWIFRKHPAYEFNNTSSWALILLAGALGALHLSLVL